MIGEKIIAIKTDRTWGYVKGDELAITLRSGDLVTAKNLTRPHLDREAILHDKEFKYKSEVKDISVVRFLGIPIVKITKEVE